MSRSADETSRQAAVPDKPVLEGLEAKWDAAWEASGIYRFDETRPRAEVFSIDTPPPTVSGSLHVGHVFSYTHTDIIARYRRMAGQAVFYPMGWDDNGLPTERRVQNYYGVRCDPSLPYDPDFAAPPDAGRPSAVAKRRTIAVSRPNFIELCEELTASDEQAFEDLFRRIGLSVDWTRTYATIDTHCRRVSQLAFLENLDRGEAYQIEAPSLWDTTFQTAVAQAELDDREVPGAYHKLRFAGTGGAADVWIDTTRPELVPSCVALVAHPDDGRYRPRFGSTVRTPVFDVEVPVLAHPLADPDKGTGIAMICTFGDTADVTWWRELDLPVRTVIGRDGRLVAEPPAAIESAGGPGRLRPPGRQDRGAGPHRDRGRLRRVRRHRRRAPAHHPSGQVLREGRQAAGDRVQPAVVHPQRRARRRPAPSAHRPGLADELGAGLHAGPLRELDLGPQRGLAHQPPALLRGAHPAVVLASTPTARRSGTTRSGPTPAPCRSTRRRTARPASTSPSGAAPAGSLAIPT